MGAPGVGKGTQAQLLSSGLGACHLSTGDLFRAAAELPEQHRTPAMTAALEVMRRGELVPDETVINMVRERVACLRNSAGFLLDGFPRTIRQSEALDDILVAEKLPLHAVVSYELPMEFIVARLSGRRNCEQCKAIFHIVSRPPKTEGICDRCGGKLFRRDDDEPEKIRTRLQFYAQWTEPLLGHYLKKGMLLPIRAEGPPHVIYRKTVSELRKRIGA